MKLERTQDWFPFLIQWLNEQLHPPLADGEVDLYAEAIMDVCETGAHIMSASRAFLLVVDPGELRRDAAKIIKWLDDEREAADQLNDSLVRWGRFGLLGQPSTKWFWWNYQSK